MATLFDTLKQRLQGSPAGASTEQAQALAQAKTGRAAPAGAGGPNLDITRERIAVQEAQAPQQQLATQAAAQDIQLQAAQEQQMQQFKVETGNLQERKLQIQDNFIQQATSIVDKFSRENRKLDMDRDVAAAEQLAAFTRLSTDSYVHKLQIEGAKARLQSEVLFEEELAKAMMGEYLDLFGDDLDFRAILNANEREFKAEMELFDFNTRKLQAKLETDAANAQAKWEAVGDIASTAVSTASKASQINWSSASTSPTPSGGGGSPDSGSAFGTGTAGPAQKLTI